MQLEPLTVTSARFGVDAYVVAMVGELDIATSDRLERELESVIERGARQLVFDLLGVTFLGSVGLGLLMGAAKRVRAHGGECVVVSADPRIVRVFEITGLDRIFRIERSLMEAIEQLVATRVGAAS